MNSLIRSESYSLRSYRGLRRAGRGCSDRQVINGIVYKIRTGISWRDLPERYGPSTPASAVMPWTACSPGPCSRSKPVRTRPTTSTGSSRSPARRRHRPKRKVHLLASSTGARPA
ncbi:transposase [Streptomyces sp. 2314.4]|uniref:transposase n=1 Tax=Streptomyces sp. 2314.4 TaxID=1881025 RepID=UPI000B89FB02